MNEKDQPNSSDGYRADIDGLRGLSVGAVILFHINKNYLPGGFCGVDFFFVISGYLVSRIILSQLKNNKFSFSEFYVRRLKRIFPASAVCVAITLYCSFFLTFPSTFSLIVNSAIASLFSFSNFFNCFFLGSGYFDNQTQNFPLLHLWSLAIEEQFYFVWPITLYFFQRSSQSFLRYFLGVVILLSTISGQLFYSVNGSVAYYMLFNRMGELMIGALLTQIDPPDKNDATNQASGVTGLLMCLYSLFYLSEESVFPGFNSLIPCFGAALVIYSGKQKTVVHQLLCFKPLVWLGLVSYSAYLYHWPIITLSKMIFTNITGFVFFNLLLLGLFATLASYFLVETPLRHSKMGKLKTFLFVYVLPCLFILVVGLFLSQHYVDNKHQLRRMVDSNSRMESSQNINTTIYIDNEQEENSNTLDRSIPKGINISDYKWNFVERNKDHLDNCFFSCLWGKCDSEIASLDIINEARSIPERCFLGSKTADKKIFITGDSHASHFTAFFDVVSKQLGFRLYNLEFPALFPCIYEKLPERYSKYAYVNEFKELAKEKIQDFDKVILAARWSKYQGDSGLYIGSFDCLEKTIDTLLSLNKKVLIMGEVPTFPQVDDYSGCPLIRPLPDDPDARCDMKNTLKDQQKLFELGNDLLQRMISKKKGVYYFDLSSYICPDGVCSYYKKNLKLYHDDDHLGVLGSSFLAKEMLEKTGVPFILQQFLE